MQLDLKQAFQQEGERLPIGAELNFSDLEFDNACPIPEPVKITGTVENQNMVVVMRYRAEVGYTRACDRCLDVASEDFVFDFQHTFLLSNNSFMSDKHYLYSIFIQLFCQHILNYLIA